MKLKKNPVPLYYQLEKVLRKRILSGKLKTDQAVPAEKELCQEFGVNRITVRQALLSLESDDLIRREQGRGTFVSFRKENPIKFRLEGRDRSLAAEKVHITNHGQRLVRPY